MNCKWNGSQSPRVVSGRHLEDCDTEGCRGCQPCTEPHCRVCSMAHEDGTCGECLAEVRVNLSEVIRLTRALPAEVAHRGVNGEAMNLLGPVSDPEARGHWETSVLSGRIVPLGCDARELDAVKVWLNDQADHALHPLWVLGTWRMVWEDALEHESDDLLTVGNAAGYLSRQLTYMAGYEDVPFEDMARDVRRCVAHLESVLHDGEQVDRGAPCMTCSQPLTRTWGERSKGDGWECKRCRTTSTEAQYQFAMKADYIAKAEWLTDADMAVRTGVKAGTVRVWCQREYVAKRLDAGRMLYSVEQVETRRDEQALAS